MTTLAHRKLKRILASRTQAELATLLGCSQQYVSRIAAGEVPKGYDLVEAFKKHLNIDPPDWKGRRRSSAEAA